MPINFGGGDAVTEITDLIQDVTELPVPAPAVSAIETYPNTPKIVQAAFELNQNLIVEIEGSYFTPDMTIASDGLTVHNFTFLNDNKIRVDATSINTRGKFDLILNNGQETVIPEAIAVQSAPWVDLRKGSDESFIIGSDLVLSKNVVSISNDADSGRPGMWFRDSKPWKSSAAFEKYKFTRGENKTIEIIFNNYDKKFMIGVGKNPRNINASSQFYQAELLLYFEKDHIFKGLYGNRNRKDYNTQLDADGWLKVKFTDDVVRGSKWYLYKLDSIEDTNWSDQSNLIISGEVDDRFKLQGEELFPIMLPDFSWNNYITALRVF